MNLVKKIKDILFEVEDEDNEGVNVVKVKDDTIENLNAPKEEIKEEKIEKKEEVPSERELFKVDSNTFTFPDFDEEEFQSNFAKNSDFEDRKIKDTNQFRSNNNVLEFEKKKNAEKRNEYSKYDRNDREERIEKKKFKPSPIISPVYGILNKDYKSSDIIDKTDNTNIDVDYVRKKAFEPKKEEIEMPKVSDFKEEITDPVVTFFEEKEEIKEENNAKESFKTIDALLEEASDEISLEDTLEIPTTNNLEAIEEELEKINEEEKQKDDNNITNEEFSSSLDQAIDDSLKEEKVDDDNDLFELIDSMYEDRKED